MIVIEGRKSRRSKGEMRGRGERRGDGKESADIGDKGVFQVGGG